MFRKYSSTLKGSEMKEWGRALASRKRKDAAAAVLDPNTLASQPNTTTHQTVTDRSVIDPWQLIMTPTRCVDIRK